MKTFSLLLWLVATVALVFSFIGMLLFIPFKGQRSSWMQMGIDLVTNIKNSDSCPCNCCGAKSKASEKTVLLD